MASSLVSSGTEIVAMGSIRPKEKCFNCGIIKDLKQLLKCSACQIGMYCDQNCQRKDYSSRHKPTCKKIAKSRSTYESLLSMHEQADGKKYLYHGEMVGYFYRETKWIKINNHSIPAPQFLINERWDQLWDMYNEALKFDSYAGMEKVLDGTLEIFRWMFFHEPCGVRYFVPILLLQLGRDQDAYNLVKFLMLDYGYKSDGDLREVINQKDWLSALPKCDKFKDVDYGELKTLTGGFFADNLYILIILGVKFKIADDVRESDEIPPQKKAIEAIKLSSSWIDLINLLDKKSPKMLKALALGYRGGSSPLGPMAMDWGLDLAGPYPDFKDVGKCYMAYFQKSPHVEFLKDVWNGKYSNFIDNDVDKNLPQFHSSIKP